MRKEIAERIGVWLRPTTRRGWLSLTANMNIEKQLSDSKIAAKDIIEDLERVILRVRRDMIRTPGPEIHALSPELFYVNLAMGGAHSAAAKARDELLRAIGMAPHTRFVHSLSERR